MALRRLIQIGCAIAATASLLAGYAGVGSWVGAAAVLGASLAWVRGVRRPSGGMTSTALLIYAGLAAAGLLAGAVPFWMILGATLALGGWDLALFDHTLAGALPASSIAHLEKKHLTSLALALGPGLLIAIIGPLIRFQMSLGVMALLVILGLFGLDRVWRALSRN
jgi:hypothetical protein